MTPTTLPATELPRSRTLTDALLAPPSPAPPTAAVAALGRVLPTDLRAAAGRGGPPVRVDGFALRAAAGAPGAGTPGPAPFHWTPRTARRAVGVWAASRVVDGRARTPSDGTRLVMDELADRARRVGARPGSLGEWLAAASGGLLAATRAEATTWATHLVTALDWSRLAPAAEVGGPDRWWDLPGDPRIGLRGRADVRVAVPGDPASAPHGDAARCSFLTVCAGRPGPTSRVELGLTPLVHVLRHPCGPLPARVVGWWPECGRALVLPVDEGLLAVSARAAVEAVRAAAVRRAARPTAA